VRPPPTEQVLLALSARAAPRLGPSPVKYSHAENPEVFIYHCPRSMSTVRTPSNFFKDTSRFAFVWQPGAENVLYPLAITVQWTAQQADLVLEPESAIEESLLAAFRPNSDDVFVGYGPRVAMCNVLDNGYVVQNGVKRFHIKFAVRQTDFTPSLEMALGGTSADSLAEMRARRLLLNENPAVESRDINTITRELFIGGQDTIMHVQRSPFPELFAQFRQEREKFLEIAWISAAVQLKLSACVAEILELGLQFAGTALNVTFWGKRKKQFQNRPASEIRIQGTCQLLPRL
jgi:hypothetical protein